MDILKNPDLLNTTDDATAILILNLAIESIDELLAEQNNHSDSEAEQPDGDIVLTLQAEREELARQIQVIKKRAMVREDNSTRNSGNSSSRRSKPWFPISQPSNVVDKKLLEGIGNLITPKKSKGHQKDDVDDKYLRNLSPRSATRKRWRNVSDQGPSLENEEGESSNISARIQTAEAETTNTQLDKSEHEEHALKKSPSVNADVEMAEAESERVERTVSGKVTEEDLLELVERTPVKNELLAKRQHVSAESEAAPSKKTKTKKADKGEKKRACLICVDEFPESQITKLSCGHEYCKVCLAELFIRATNNEASYPPKCCKPIPLESVRASLDEDIIENFLERKVEWDSTNRTYCSNRQCQAFIAPENIHQRDARCVKCRTRTCARCKKTFHRDNEPCSADNDAQQTLVLELMKQKRWKRCTKCGTGVSRSYGCNTMTCTCGHIFCYECGQPGKTCGCLVKDTAESLQDRLREEAYDREQHMRRRFVEEQQNLERQQADEQRALDAQADRQRAQLLRQQAEALERVRRDNNFIRLETQREVERPQARFPDYPEERTKRRDHDLSCPMHRHQNPTPTSSENSRAREWAKCSKCEATHEPKCLLICSKCGKDICDKCAVKVTVNGRIVCGRVKKSPCDHKYYKTARGYMICPRCDQMQEAFFECLYCGCGFRCCSYCWVRQKYLPKTKMRDSPPRFFKKPFLGA